jgi:hypothetical protein
LTGSRRNGTQKIGPARAGRYAGEHSSEQRGDLGYLAWGGWEHDPRDGAAEHIARHAVPKRSASGRKTARMRARKVAPAAAIAATLAAGAAAYGLVGSGGTAPGALTAAVASAPPGGYALSGGNILANASASASDSAPHAAVTTAAVSAGTGSAPAARTAAATSSVGRLAEAIASDMSASRRAVTALAKSAAASSAAASAAKAQAAPAATATVAKAPPPTATVAKAPPKAATTTLTCDASRGMLPDNVTAIVSFLLAHGYTHNAAAGIAGNIYRESGGNPESVGTGGGGLIGWTPLPSGFVTGNSSADLQTQLAALLTYNQGWAQYVPTLNAASTPAAAADIYVTDFERAGIPAAGQREASAEAVAGACGL